MSDCSSAVSDERRFSTSEVGVKTNLEREIRALLLLLHEKKEKKMMVVAEREFN